MYTAPQRCHEIALAKCVDLSHTQFAIVLVAALAVVSAEPKAEAKPGLLAAAYTGAPLLSAPFVAAHSSQAIYRNYNGLVAAPLVSAPLTAAYPYAAYPYAAAPYAAYAAAAPLRYAAGAPILY